MGTHAHPVGVRRPLCLPGPQLAAGRREPCSVTASRSWRVREDIELDVEAYRIDKITRGQRPFQKHQLGELEATRAQGESRVEAGTIMVRTAQPLGNLAWPSCSNRSRPTAWRPGTSSTLTSQGGPGFPVLRLPAACR